MLKTKGCELKLPEFFAHFVKGNFKSKAKLNDFFNMANKKAQYILDKSDDYIYI